jgi:hypothetical protein
MAGLHQTLRVLLRSLQAGDAQRAAMFRTMPLPDAEARAVELLTRSLSPAQREQYKSFGYFDVIGGESGKRYRIKKGRQMNVEQLDQNGRRSQLLCFMPQGDLPVGDVMLAQKVALELFETEAMGVANRRPNWDLADDFRWARRLHH